MKVPLVVTKGGQKQNLRAFETRESKVKVRVLSSYLPLVVQNRDGVGGIPRTLVLRLTTTLARCPSLFLGFRQATQIARSVFKEKSTSPARFSWSADAGSAEKTE